MTQLDPHDQNAPLEPKPDRGMEGLKLVAWGLLCTLVWLGVVVLAGAIVHAVDGESEASSETGLLIFVIGQALAGSIGWFVLPRWIMRRRGLPDLIAWRRPTSTDVGLAFAGLVAIYVVLFIYATIVHVLGAESLEPQSTIDDDRLFVHTSVMIALGATVVLCAPIYEEAFARGFVLGGLRPQWGVAPAFVISAAVFSALHADLGSLIPFAIAAVILGLVYVRSGSLTAASLAHFGFNLIGFTATLVQQLG